MSSPDEETSHDADDGTTTTTETQVEEEVVPNGPKEGNETTSPNADETSAVLEAEKEVSQIIQAAASSASDLSVTKIQEETIRLLRAKVVEQRVEIIGLKLKVHELQYQLQSSRPFSSPSLPASPLSTSGETPSSPFHHPQHHHPSLSSFPPHPSQSGWTSSSSSSSSSSSCPPSPHSSSDPTKKSRRRSATPSTEWGINRKGDDKTTHKLAITLPSSLSSSSSSSSSSDGKGASSSAGEVRPKSPRQRSPRHYKPPPPPPPERTNRPKDQPPPVVLSDMSDVLMTPRGGHVLPLDEIDKRFLCVVHCKGKEPSMSRYYLGREKSLAEHIEILCRRFHIEDNPSRFAIRVVDQKHYLTNEEFDFPACYEMPDDKMLSLSLRPEICVSEILHSLQIVSEDNISTLKMNLYQLRATLAEGDPELADELIRQGGVEKLLIEYQRSKVASIVSLLLGLFNEIMGRPSFPWERITAEFVQETVNRSLVVNVQRPALETLKWIALNPQFGPSLVLSCFRSISSSTPLQPIVEMVNCANVDLKILGLTLLNAFLHASIELLLQPETVQSGHDILQSILDEINRGDINNRLRTQIDMVPHVTYNRQLHLYQNYRMWNSFVDFRQKFDETNEQHQQLLGKLWLLCFSEPGDSDLSKVPRGPHHSWLSIGFRSDDPVKQLQTNVLLLKNLLYYTETNQDRVRKVIAKQSSSLFFPIATASFSVTNILCEMLGFSQDLHCSQCKSEAYKILLDDGVRETDTMGELNSCVLRMMEQMWGMLKSPSWDDLPGLSQMMHVLVRETLSSFQPDTLANFTSLLQKKAKQVMEGTADEKRKHTGSFFGRIKKPSSSVKKKKIKFKIFGVSLDEIMRNEKINDPFAEIPTVFTILRDAIVRLNGMGLEGIFRISVNLDELERMKERLNNGDYDLQFENAHYPASLLKAWLRELSSPLIPCSLYDECINAAGDKDATTSIILKLPEHNYKIVQEISRMLQQLGKPENVAKTKMGFTNLALVFAPAFLQPPPGSSASAFLVNSERERMFVEGVIEVVK